MTQNHILLIFLLLVVIASGADITADLSEDVNTGHLIQEAILLTFGVTASIWMVRTLHTSRSEIRRLKAEMEEIESKRPEQPPELIESRKRLADAIATQFAAWDLSQSEKEVGLLLLKGLSLKEIALLRGTAEKTIRQQASAVYRKADVSGRHAFAAWFIEDIL